MSSLNDPTPRPDLLLAGELGSGLASSSKIGLASSGSGAEFGDVMDRRKKIKRAGRACLPCRSKKRKCGGKSPKACPNCVEDEVICEWPVEDGRTSRAKRQKWVAKLPLPDLHNPSEDGQTFGEAIDWDTPGDWLAGLYGPVTEHPEYTPGPSDPTLYSAYTPNLFLPNASLPVDLLRDFQPDSALAYDQVVLSPLDAQQQVEQLMLSDYGDGFSWPSAFDSSSFFHAMSSRIPTVEEGSAPDMASPALTDAVPPVTKATVLEHPFSSDIHSTGKPDDKEKTVKIIWWRPHGHTAIAPGLQRITLKVRVDRSAGMRQASASSAGLGSIGIPEDPIGADGMPNVTIMRHLLDLFALHFGSQFPYLERQRLEADLEARTGSVFLLNCIAATASRFSDHPSLALPDLEPHSYGNIFLNVARGLLGSILSVPSRDTVVAFTLLAGIGHGIDSESEEWMMTGMAVRMALDLGLHLDPGEESTISREERRLNRLAFWSVCILDLSLSFGVGRETALRIESITQALPSDEDLCLNSAKPTSPRSPFPFAAKQMLSYGPLINILNGPHDEGGTWLGEAQAAIRRAVQSYNALPVDMQWNASNFQRQSRAQQASIFLQMHLWMHTIIASGYLTDTDNRRTSGKSVMSGLKSGTLTPSSLAAANMWRNSARTIGDILVLSDIIDPFAYHALPFVNQAFFVAGCCYIKEVEQQQRRDIENALPPWSTAHSTATAMSVEDKDKESELFRALLKSVASNNIATLQQGLAKQSTYWSGVAWVAQALEERLSGVAAGSIDLGKVTDKLASFVSVADAGLLRDQVEMSIGRPQLAMEPQTQFNGVMDIAL